MSSRKFDRLQVALFVCGVFGVPVLHIAHIFMRPDQDCTNIRTVQSVSLIHLVGDRVFHGAHLLRDHSWRPVRLLYCPYVRTGLEWLELKSRVVDMMEEIGAQCLGLRPPDEHVLQVGGCPQIT